MIEFLNNSWVLAFLIYGILIGTFGIIFIIKHMREKTKKQSFFVSAYKCKPYFL